MVRISPSDAGGAGSIPGQGANIPPASGPKKKKTQNIRSNIVTNSINTLRNVQVKKKKNEKGVEKDRGEKESPEACLSTWL